MLALSHPPSFPDRDTYDTPLSPQLSDFLLPEEIKTTVPYETINPYILSPPEDIKVEAPSCDPPKIQVQGCKVVKRTDAKTLRHRARNTESARRSRQRTKKRIEELEELVDKLRTANEELTKRAMNNDDTTTTTTITTNTTTNTTTN